MKKFNNYLTYIIIFKIYFLFINIKGKKTII
jgi:hypothetical protein